VGTKKKRGPLTICLSASGGGHFRQLLDLEPLWGRHRHFIVTESTVLARSFEERETLEYVPHFALGQARMGDSLTMLGAALRSVWKSARIVARHRPDVVISTGAGSQVFLLIWARLAGAKIFLIDSFARFDAPSKFARIAGRLAHVRIAQSTVAAEKWPGSVAFDPLRIVPAAPPQKESLLVATVGAVLPFDRLSRLVAEAKRSGRIAERVIIQTGRGAAAIAPFGGLEFVEELDFVAIRGLLDQARIVVCHGGTGSLLTALSAGCKVIAIPRTIANGDAYDDHQLEITRLFEARGLIVTATDEPSFLAALEKVRSLPTVEIRLDQSRTIAFIEGQLASFFD
jgi:UDP-N-acetylglucosamine--N-acetylmuramyl-(pentapeptide) pyrophosphoryl-undecaprenol N-acetylglucosamine transferase